jgi:very-short-patch-repair endonuclease
MWTDGWVNSIESIRSLAASQHGFVSRRQLTARSIPQHIVRHQIASRGLLSVTRQVLRISGAPDVAEGPATIAVLDAPDGAVLSHTSAAGMWGLPGFRIDRDHHVVVPERGKPRRTRTATVHYHLGLPDDHVTIYRGVRVTSPVLTMFHLAAICHPDRVARAFDRAWSDNLVTGQAANRLLERIAASGRNGIVTMRQILETRGPGYVPPASNVEGRLVEILENAGFPRPRRQVDIGGEHWIGRVDFVWDDIAGGIEVQSERFHTAYLDQRSDAQRLEALENAGLSMLEVWDHDIFHRPWVVVERVRAFRTELNGFGAQN